MDMLAMRTEVHCVKCGGHLVLAVSLVVTFLIVCVQGHVFDDGIIWEVPTGKR